jgi:pyrroloquinoline quinone biosynthesis protein B
MTHAKAQPAPDRPHLLVLGIAQDAGYPQADCDKACCARTRADPSLSRSPTSLALLLPQQRSWYLFEATPAIGAQIDAVKGHLGDSRGWSLDGIFLTHAHIGHYTGLMHLGREVMGSRGIPVYAMPRMRAFLTDNGPWSQLVALGNIELRSLEGDGPTSLGEGVSVRALRVPHREEFSETVAFRIDRGERSALFLPDIDKWERWDTDINQLLLEVDVAFVDGTFYENGEIPGRDMSQIPHPFIEESLARFAPLPADRKSVVHFIHFNHTNPVLEVGGRARAAVEAAGYRLAWEGQLVEL